jgi:hypothetical protein
MAPASKALYGRGVSLIAADSLSCSRRHSPLRRDRGHASVLLRPDPTHAVTYLRSAHPIAKHHPPHLIPSGMDARLDSTFERARVSSFARSLLSLLRRSDRCSAPTTHQLHRRGRRHFRLWRLPPTLEVALELGSMSVRHHCNPRRQIFPTRI